MNDPIGDFIIRIKNAGFAGKKEVSAPFSKMKMAIAELLSAKGFVGAVSKKMKEETPRSIVVELVYENGKPVVNGVQRISKPSRHLYESAKNIKQFRRGFGMTVFSTPKGIMADVDAKKANLGGEILFNIW